MKLNFGVNVKSNIFVKLFLTFVNTNMALVKLSVSPRMFISMLFMVFTSITSARTYYVSPNGNDTNPGTISQPWGTLNRAFSSAIAGDTVYFRGGVYLPTSESQLGYIDKNGTINDPICFQNFPGEIPIIDCSKVLADNFTYAIRGNYANYIKIKGLTIRNLFQSNSTSVVQAVDFYKGTGIWIEQCVAYNIEGVGFGFHGCDELYIKNCDAFNLCDSLQLPVPGQNGTGFACGTGLSYGESMYNAHCYMEGCRTWNFSDNGFALGGVGYMELKNCWAFDGGALYGDGIGFKLSISTRSDTTNPLSHKIINCISANNGMCGFTPNNLNGTVFNAHYFNNFSYHNGYKPELKNYDSGFGYGFMILNYSGSTPAPNEMYTNNISFQNQRGSVYTGDAYRHEKNSWDQSVEVTNEDFINLNWEEMLLPRKSDGSLPDINFGKLAPGSDLINAGKNVGLPFNGLAPDLGWYESSYEENTQPPLAVPVIVSAAIENATPARLELNYNLTLANIIPSVSAFSVRVNNETRNVSSVAVSGTKVLLTLASPVAYGNSVTVAYTKPASNPIQTTAGGQADSFSARTVTNNVGNANQPPVISISSPTKSNSYIAPATITIETTVSDPDNNLSRVEFYQGTLKIGELSASPYTFVWKDVAEGTYSLTAIAIDQLNLRTTSLAVSVTVEKSASATNQLPNVSISVTNRKKPRKHDNVTILAEATDPDGNINKVVLKNGDVVIEEKYSAPYIFTLSDVDTGRYDLQAIAFDNLGASNTASLQLIIDGLFDYNTDYISIYPNPNSGTFNVDLDPALSVEERTLSIVSLTGQQISKVQISGDTNSLPVNMPDIPSGTYIVILSKDKDILSTRKFIKF